MFLSETLYRSHYDQIEKLKSTARICRDRMLLLNQLLSLQIDAMLANERNIKLYK